jgi:hypothetical protein
MRRQLISAGVGALAFFAAAAAIAGSIVVSNASFESPTTGFVSINIDSWQKAPKPDWYQENGGLSWSQLIGIFMNTATNSADHIDNCDGNQAIWLFADPDVALFQDYDSVDWNGQSNQLSATFQVGKSYHLTVGVIGTGGGMMEGATLDLRLYYRVGSNFVNVGVTTLSNTPSVFSNNTHFVDCTLDVPAVRANDTWAGQHIGVQFISTVTTPLQGGYWDLDNVRLVEITEPFLANAKLSNGLFSLSLLSEPGKTFEILRSANSLLPLSNWTSAGFVTNASGSNTFSETSVGAARFYRARQLP